MTSELETKLARVRTLLAERKLDALLLQRSASFAWLTAGAESFIDSADSNGVAALLVTAEDRVLLTNSIEEPRLRGEVLAAEQDWRYVVQPWHAQQPPAERLAQSYKLGVDGPLPGAVDLSAALAELRAALLPAEQARFRELGALCAAAMDEAIRAVRPGMSEYEIAALLAQAALRRGVWPTVNLVATDERVFAYRHPLPTLKRMERYAMLVLCGRQRGLVASITRLVHFGPLPAELAHKAAAVARVDAAMIAATRPGQTLGEVFAAGQAAYAEAGYPDEWRYHHQGGAAGYVPRELLATPDCELAVRGGQVYAWNPSIAGAKSEDSVLITPKGFEVLTAIEGWPAVAVSVSGDEIKRPAILVRD